MSRAGQRIITLIQDIATRVAKQHAPQIFYGKVTGVEPLKIRVDERYEVGEGFLLLDSRCVETWIKIPQDDEYEHVHKIKGTTKNTKVTGLTTACTAGGASVTDTIGHTHEIEFDSQKALENIKLWRGLVEGDVVKIIRVGSLHYVLERVEGISNDSK